MFGKIPLIWTPPSPLFRSRLATRCIRCWKAAQLAGGSAAIIGCGPIGLMAVAVAKAARCIPYCGH